MKKGTRIKPNIASMRLYDDRQRRLYINGAEREQLLKVVEYASGPDRTLALTLVYTGCRISEALTLAAASVQLEAQVISVRCLKKRGGRVVMREIPIPPSLVAALEREHGIHAAQQAGNAEHALLWPIGRKTAWLRIKALMLQAGIHGVQATPKGLRHGYGIHAILCGVSLNMLQKWMGHAQMSTTAIYANATGAEEREVARRMWSDNQEAPRSRQR